MYNNSMKCFQFVYKRRNLAAFLRNFFSPSFCVHLSRKIAKALSKLDMNTAYVSLHLQFSNVSFPRLESFVEEILRVEVFVSCVERIWLVRFYIGDGGDKLLVLVFEVLTREPIEDSLSKHSLRSSFGNWVSSCNFLQLSQFECLEFGSVVLPIELSWHFLDNNCGLVLCGIEFKIRKTFCSELIGDARNNHLYSIYIHHLVLLRKHRISFYQLGFVQDEVHLSTRKKRPLCFSIFHFSIYFSTADSLEVKLLRGCPQSEINPFWIFN